MKSSKVTYRHVNNIKPNSVAISSCTALHYLLLLGFKSFCLSMTGKCDGIDFPIKGAAINVSIAQSFVKG